MQTTCRSKEGWRGFGGMIFNLAPFPGYCETAQLASFDFVKLQISNPYKPPSPVAVTSESFHFV